MTYQTELPEGFKTWNELWNNIKKDKVPSDWVEPFANYMYQVDYIKAKCYDEMKEEKRIYTEQQVREAFIEGMKFIAVHPDYYEKDADEYMQTINPH